MPKRLAAFAALLALISGEAAAQQRDPNNPTCPPNPNWSSYPQMRFTTQQMDGRTVLLAEGQIDDDMLPRLQQALDEFRGEEIWLRSSGGSASAGNQAGRMIRERGLATRIPAGWACFGACAFMFMGGIVRSINPGGLFIVQMFTFTTDPSVRRRMEGGDGGSDKLPGEIAQASALQATEDNDYLIRMGISRRLLTEIIYRQDAVPSPGIRRCLTPEEAQSYFVVNRGYAATHK